jgi:hypothetical protein
MFTALSAVDPTRAAESTLSGKMLELQYLVGTWSCVDKFAAMGTAAAGSVTSTVSYKILPQNTIGYTSPGSGFYTSGFFGYLDAKQLWWNSAADNHGGVFLGSGKGGASLVLTGNGISADEGSAHQRDTLTKISDTKYELRAETEEGGKWVLGVVSTCTKS